MTPPATAPTGPATTRPVPAPAAAPIRSALALGETVTIAVIAVTAKIKRRVGTPRCYERRPLTRKLRPEDKSRRPKAFTDSLVY
jgi:hypothetical protein